MSQAQPGVIVRKGFLPLGVFAKVLTAIDRLAASWVASQELELLGRGRTTQIRPADLMARSHLDVIRGELAPRALQWAQASGFRFLSPPQLQVFPVRMLGDADDPAYQEPHVDSRADQPNAPICANVFYAKASGVVGGELEVARSAGADLADPIVVSPTPNTLVTFPGERLHRVRPLYAGERLSLVVNFY